MFKAVIFSKIHNREFSNTFMSEQKANEFIDNHPFIEKLDPKDYTIEIYEMQADGSKKPEEIVDPMVILRNQRNNILCKTDWLFISDVKIDQKWRKKYVEYRDYLRNLPKRVNEKQNIYLEPFAHWLRRNYPEEFMDGGDAEEIVKKFNTYLD